MNATTKSISPGLHMDLPSGAYHALPFCSNSRLTKIARSPLHLQHSIEAPDEKTPALLMGEAAHSCILEPHRFEEQFAQAPECDRRTKEGKATWAAFCESARDRKPLKQDEWATCQDITRAVWAHPAARQLLQNSTEHEVTALFELEGLGCKARFDAPAFGLGTIIDIKTTEDASPAAFTRSIFNYGYHRQGAFYLHGAAKCGKPAEHFVIIAVEKCPPYGVGVYRITDEAIDGGWRQLQPLIQLYRECEAAGRWPGYGDDVQDIGLPPWAMKQIENL